VEKRTACFPTFPQPLGKLVAKKPRRTFHRFPQLLLLVLLPKKEKKECDISNELKHVTFLKSFDNASVTLLRAVCPCCILNRMVHCKRSHLDASFAALSDATRRGILERLGRADASIAELAGKFQMTLTGIKKHIGVLERTGLVTTEKAGRVRTCKLGPRRLEEEAAWIESYRQLWHARFEELDKIVEELKRTERVHARQKRK